MGEELEKGDTYYEVQVDRETLVLLGFGFVALLVAAFLVGRWTAPDGATEDAPVASIALESEPPSASDQLAVDEFDEVDGEPMFGESPVSVEGAPPITAVPDAPLPEKEPKAPTKPPPARASGKPEGSATPPPASGTKPIPEAAAEGWIVQVAAVKGSQEAKVLQDELIAKGWPVRVQREGGYSKVQVGPFAKRSEADEAERRLKREEGVSTWVKRS